MGSQHNGEQATEEQTTPWMDDIQLQQLLDAVRNGRRVGIDPPLGTNNQARKRS